MDSLGDNHKKFIKKHINIKTQQRFRRQKHNAFTEELNKIALSANDKRIQSIDFKEMHAYGANKETIHKNEEIKCINNNKTIRKMINCDDVTKENIK